MSTFLEKFDEVSSVTLTENGCPTFSSSLNANLDFFGMCGAMRGELNDVLDLFKKAYTEDKDIALKNLFYLRDIRGGQGERELFRYCGKFLCSILSKKEFEKFLSYIPEYGRWDDILDILSFLLEEGKEEEKINSITSFLRKQLLDDYKKYKNDENFSLLAKWFPLANNTSNMKKKKLARFLSKSLLFDNERQTRNVIVTLRKRLHIIEQKISSNKWNEVEYSKVPSRANKKYTKAFLRHDEERYKDYLLDVMEGKEKMNSSALYPYEIVFNAGKENNLSWDAMWKSLPDYTCGNSALCVVDVSASMGCFNYESIVHPIHVALSLGLYFAERNKSQFKDYFITFSEEPHLVKIQGKSLYEKLIMMSNSEWGCSTDIEKVFDKYLETALLCKPEERPKSIIIISDMEFNSCTDTKLTFFENIKKKFREANVELPSLVFWNVDARHKNIPVRYNEHGTVLVSGLSPTIFSYVMEGKTPVEFMKSVLNGNRYKSINIWS